VVSPSEKSFIYDDEGTYQNIPDSIKLLITLALYPIIKDARNVRILNIQ